MHAAAVLFTLVLFLAVLVFWSQKTVFANPVVAGVFVVTTGSVVTIALRNLGSSK
jgi:hypothetical protein